jgi:hypothetical protein
MLPIHNQRKLGTSRAVKMSRVANTYSGSKMQQCITIAKAPHSERSARFHIGPDNPVTATSHEACQILLCSEFVERHVRLEVYRYPTRGSATCCVRYIVKRLRRDE